MADIGEKLDSRQPLGVRRLDLLDGGVQVLDENAHDLPQARITMRPHASVHHLDRVRLVEKGMQVCRRVSYSVDQERSPQFPS